jgi:hypothetical protein
MKAEFKEFIFPPDILRKLLSMSPDARAIAERWRQSWPVEVSSLIRRGLFLEAIERQAIREYRARTDPSLAHLAEWERIAAHDLSLGPPLATSTPARGCPAPMHQLRSC